MTLHLSEFEHDVLRMLARHGDARLGMRPGECPVSTAIRLAQAGAVKIVGDPQRVEITAQGRAFARRVAA